MADEDIAVVGVTGRYPESPDVETLWRNLTAGRDCVTEIPENRWDWRNFADAAGAEQGRHSYSRWGGFLDDIDMFDPGFFNILPKDAAAMDPQERLFLETCWLLLEGSGYLGSSTHEPSTGVFVGLMHGTYGNIGATGWPQGNFRGPRSSHWSTANRISHFFDFNGPSFAVDSACSSSLTAVHLACESIRRQECSMALAGGVNLLLHPAHYTSLCSMNMLARDGACKVFDERADGFVPGEGVGAVLLKPLARAIDDGDHIWGVIKGSFLNSEGRTMGYTVPSPVAQEALISATLRRSAVDARTIGYVEAHGTGTSLGDPIELAGLTRAYTKAGVDSGSCWIGSVKANIGHLEGAAGIAGLTKALLQVKFGKITPSVHLENPNPKIDFERSPFRPARSLTDWEAQGHPRRAAVSSFGAGGADVHVIVEQPPEPATDPDPQSGSGPGVLLLSARTRGQLQQLARETLDSLGSGPLKGASIESLAYTSQVGRRDMRERVAIVADDLPCLCDRMSAYLNGVEAPGVHSGSVRRTPGRPGTSPAEHENSDAAAQSWAQGNAVDWHHSWAGRRPGRVPLPAYPFTRKRYWAEGDDGRNGVHDG
ncbi:beta-ketoacyl synthase N-terminal-like domain-containing protein [Streptomyces pathocidini]|uniref:type I polyketide synthase n=1 Tax=Streptomyces pathocidini TaxID=1650571 RepID=UPI0033D780C3